MDRIFTPIIIYFLSLIIGECRNLCLSTTAYQCRSATYDSNSGICRLTEETRRSAPSDFRIAERGVDYIENECSESEWTLLLFEKFKKLISRIFLILWFFFSIVHQGCEYMDQPGTYLPYTDTYLPRVNDIGKKNLKAQKI